jgi:3-phytase/alkaline phosphatase D
VASVYAKPDKNNGRHKAHKYGQVTVADVESLGVVVFPTGTMFQGTEVGGLSGITYDAKRDVYYALSDDRSEEAPSRFYSVNIDVSDGSLDDGDVTFLDVTFLRDHRGNLYEELAIDPEGIELLNPGQLYISTEGDDDTDPMTDPFVDRFNPAGKQNRALPVPGKFLYSVDDGNQVRDNLGFESLTSTPNRRYLVTATENALLNDGPIATLTNDSPARVLLFDARKKQPMQEFIYCVGPIPKAPVPPGAFADNGLVDLQALDNMGTHLAMERSFAVGVGNTVRLYETSVEGATDYSNVTALNWDGCQPSVDGAMSKELAADFEADLGVTPDNLEGMGFGPFLPDGRRLLIVVSDNNFNPSQVTQFIALAVTLEAASD